MDQKVAMDDFWWLSPDHKVVYRYLNLWHHATVSDDEDLSCKNWYSETLTIADIAQWHSRFNGINIYRSLKVTGNAQGRSKLLGPFLIDIDNECENLEGLKDALDVAIKTTDYLIGHRKLGSGDIRIFFSGRKGFNLEVVPSALGIRGSIQDQIAQSANELGHIIDYLPGGNAWGETNQVSSTGTVIDRIYGDRFKYELKHPCIRLHGSWNKWIASSGIRCQRKIQLSIGNLRRLTIEDILARSQNRVG